MNPIDLLLTIIVVTILVTLVLGVGSYVAYKLRVSRQPLTPEEGTVGPKYFYRYEPPSEPELGAVQGASEK